jgi:PadR family transcriptional regulator, regulatory protein PadR
LTFDKRRPHPLVEWLKGEILPSSTDLLQGTLDLLILKTLIRADWGASENNRKAKYYSLTRTGQKQLEVELENWGRISTAIALVLE